MLALGAMALTGTATGHAAADTPTLVTKAGHTPQGAEKASFSITANEPITRSEVQRRARSWIDARVPYSQTSWYNNQFGSYRQDCSGYVSMAWGLDNSYTTWTLPQFMDTIARSDLQLGDALWKHDSSQQHIALFIRWNDAARTQPVVWEEYDFGQVAEERVWSASYANTFTPKRYKNCGVTRTSRASSSRTTRATAGTRCRSARCSCS
ncbi:hypothetical protein ABZX92_42885, partial [Lentzea sp. NPDC006480]|uniref:hypothetical protein n=1 Tax=Lentzea sp. NPDC006480 TaxID=3157176 RepID=UPI0033AA9275